MQSDRGLVPLCLFMYTTAVVFSEWTWTGWLRSRGRNTWQALQTVRSSNVLMSMRASLAVHLPCAARPVKRAPYPLREASVVRVAVEMGMANMVPRSTLVGLVLHKSDEQTQLGMVKAEPRWLIWGLRTKRSHSYKQRIWRRACGVT